MGKMKDLIITSTANGFTKACVPPTYVSLSNTAPVQACTTVATPYGPATLNEPKKEKNMCYDCDMDCDSSDMTDDAKARQYLAGRLYGVKDELETEAQKTFKLRDDDAPTSWEELTKRIADGQFTYDPEVKKKTPWYYGSQMSTGVTWRAPDSKPDNDGFKAYKDKLETAYQDALDTIKIAAPADGLKALKDFENITFS